MAAITRLRTLLISFAMLVIGVLLGIVYGWSSGWIVNTGPWQLAPVYQGVYVQAVADAYAAEGREDLALERLSFFCGQDGVLAAIGYAQARYGGDPQAQGNLDQLRTLITDGAWSQSTDEDVCNVLPIDSRLRMVYEYFPIAAAVAAVGVIGYVIFQVVRGAGEEPTVARTTAAGRPLAGPPPRKPPKGVPSLETAKSPAARGAAMSATAERTDYESVGPPPLVQFMTTYLHGDDLYDDTFSIETASGQFLGETGVAIAETIEERDGKKVTAFELWLFDKNDIRTVTKVVMSEHAFNDDAIKARLAPKGEAVLARVGDTITLETATLRVKGRLVDVSYGSGPYPPNSFFERITIELAAWPREGTSGGGTPPSP